MSKKIVFVGGGLILILIVYSLMGQIFSAIKAGDRLTQALEDLQKLQIKNQELKRQISQIKSPQYVEQQARDKLGLAKEGETVVVIPEDVLQKVLGVSKKVEEIKLPNPIGWLKVFFK